MPGRFLAGFLMLLLSWSTTAGDRWPQYHGPQHNRTSAEAIGLTHWPDHGPPVVWKVTTSTGFSSFAIGDEQIFTLVQGNIDGVDREVCVSLGLVSGKQRWASPLGPAEYDGGGDAGAADNRGGDGPRSTPSYDSGRVYVLDSRLILNCFDAGSGEIIWTQNILKDYGARLISWQNAASPLVDGQLVFVMGGGEGQALLAFDKVSGQLAWKGQDDGMTHATPTAATIHGVRQIIFFTQSGLVATVPETGQVLWRQSFSYRTSAAASPVVYRDIVYCSAGYGVGAGAFRVVKVEGGFESQPIWVKPNDLMNHWSTPVCKDGYLYGLFGHKKYGKAPLQCVMLESGEVQWSQPGYGPGNCILVGEHLVVLSDRGEVALVEATPREYRELARASLLEGKCWSMPSFSNGHLYARSTKQGLCVDLR